MTEYVDVNSVLAKIEKAYDDLTGEIERMRMMRTAYGYDIEELGKFALYLQELGVTRDDVKNFIGDLSRIYEAVNKNFNEQLQKVYENVRINTLLSANLIRPEAAIQMMFPIESETKNE